MRITAKFRVSTEHAKLELNEHLAKLADIARRLSATDAFAKNWFLRANTLDEARFYPLEEQGSISTAIQAVLNTRFKRGKGPRAVLLWNGCEEQDEGAAINYRYECEPILNELEIEYPNSAAGGKRLGNTTQVAELVMAIVSQWDPAFVSVAPSFYFNHQVFKDRPGIGWMLYLPRDLTVQQVPEAHALIPASIADQEKPRGTIVVSTTEGFDIQNPAHVQLANAIEIRLVDQDLLPRYMDL